MYHCSPVKAPDGESTPSDARLSASDYEALRSRQRPQPPPHVKASEAAHVLAVAKPRAAPVWEGYPMLATGVVPARCKAEQGPVQMAGEV